MTDADDPDNLALLANTLAQAESLQHSVKQAEGGIDLFVNTNKTEFMCFKQKELFLRGRNLQLINKFTYLGSNISSTESDVHVRLA